MSAPKTIRVGSSSTLEIPSELLDKYGLTAGDEVQVVLGEAGLLIVPRDSTLKDALNLYEEGAESYKVALRDLV